MKLSGVSTVIIQYLMVGLVTNMGGMAILGTTVCVCILFTSYFWIVFLYIGWLFYDKATIETGGRRSNAYRSSGLHDYFRDYFPVKLVKTVDLDPKRNYIFCYFPHGFQVFGVKAAFCTESLGFRKLFPGLTMYVMGTSFILCVPFLREVALALGACAVTKKSLDYILGNDTGGNCALLAVGGVSEAYSTKPGKYRFLLKNRKKFVRVALKNGAPLVPVIGFGENDIYDHLIKSDSFISEWINGNIFRPLRMCMVLPRGQFFFVPYRKPITVVVGQPLEVQKIPEPTENDIDVLHAKFVKCLTSLFEEEKHKYVEDAETTFVKII